ncbi:MAG: hypothetical protein AUK39_02440 [Dehalococcoidia bacterium CG2_30_46_19]|nr:MAG: hypothetical protein AUK39_02440 [Dehalococcoidia bacterium CG2_30_46_19]
MNLLQMNARDTHGFILSKEGKEAIYFLYNYLETNVHLRRKRQLGLLYNYRTAAKIPDSALSGNQLTDKLLAKRTFCIEIIAQTIMSLEDLAAYCLAFEKPLEDLPKNIVGYTDTKIGRFWGRSFSNDYFSDLLLLPVPSEITDDKKLITKIETIQNQNIEAFNFHFKKFVEYRNLFNRFYNKNKHGNPLFFRFTAAQYQKLDNIDKEDLDLVLYYASHKTSTSLRAEAIILGRNTIEKSIEIMRHATDILFTLIIRRLDYLKYNGRYPPTFIFGENPLEREEWRKYKKKIESLLPEPTKISGHLDITGVVDVSKQEEWLHSGEWESKWFKQKGWEFEEKSKVKKEF